MEDDYVYFVSCRYKNEDAHFFLHMSSRLSKSNIREWTSELMETIIDVENKEGNYIVRSDVVIVSFQEIL